LVVAEKSAIEAVRDRGAKRVMPGFSGWAHMGLASEYNECLRSARLLDGCRPRINERSEDDCRGAIRVGDNDAALLWRKLVEEPLGLANTGFESP
jgi:hypothetical protein